MTQDEIVLEYSIVSLPFGNKIRFLLYNDGKLTAIKGETILKEVRISPEQVQSYAERLVKDNFFGYHPFPSFIFDGLVETMTLNYKGKSRTINSGNQTRRTLFKDIVSELGDLVK